jgi:hypothetical protein
LTQIISAIAKCEELPTDSDFLKIQLSSVTHLSEEDQPLTFGSKAVNFWKLEISGGSD